jgi:hypothetical protein
MKELRKLEKGKERLARQAVDATNAKVVATLKKLDSIIAAVYQPGKENSEFDRVLHVLRTLSQKEDMPIAIVGGFGAIYHGYKRYTHDMDIVVAQRDLDRLLQVVPNYGITVTTLDRNGWHTLHFEGVAIDVVPEGVKPRQDAPTTIPGPKQLGVPAGLGYATLEGWMETKIASARQQDRADVVQVLKKVDPGAIDRIRKHLAQVHPIYLHRFEGLATAAVQEKEQEEERGGSR